MNDWYAAIAALRLWVGLAVFASLFAWESLAPCFRCFPTSRPRLAHAGRNLCLSGVNAMVVSLCFIALWHRCGTWAAARHWGVLNVVRLADAAHAVGAVLLLDLWTYGWHRANHRWQLLWRFHRMHHSDAGMDVTSANRFHPGEIVISSLLRAAVLPAIGAQLGELALYEAIMFPIVQLHHANIALPPWLDRGLRTVIVTPAMHKVHHSRLRRETDSNYTSLLSVWDRVFGSFRLRAGTSALNLGLDGLDGPEWQGLTGLLTTPFRQARAVGKDAEAQP